MTIYAWKTGITGFWGAANNWMPTGVPDATDAKADIIQAGTYTVTVDPSTTFDLDAAILGDAAAELDVKGTLNFTGVDNTLALEAGTLRLDDGGTIQGATIQSDGGTLAGSGGTFDAVTYQGELDLPGDSVLNTEGGLTVESATGTLPGTIVFGYDATLNVAGGLTVGAPGSPGSILLENSFNYLDFDDSETLNHAAVTLSASYDYIEATNYTLTLGADTTVDLSGSDDYLLDSITNLGSISLTGGYTYVENDYTAGTFDNKASLSVDNGSLSVYVSTFTNQGSIDVGSGGLLYIGASTGFTNSGTVTVESGGELQLYSPPTNTGTITIESGATLDLQYAVTLTQLENTGIAIETGATLEISGTLDLQGGTLDIAATGPFSNVLITGGGTIANGTVVPDGGTLTLQYATFDAITYRGELDVAASSSLSTQGGLTVESAAGTLPGTIAIEYGAGLYVTGGLTVGTSASPGSIQLQTDYAYVIFSDSETLDNAAVTISGTVDYIDSVDHTLTLGAHTTVDLSGDQDYLRDSITNLGSIGLTAGYAYVENNYTASTFDNHGSLSVDGGSLSVYSSTFSNEGHVSVGSGGYLDIDAGTFTSTTAILIGNGGTLEIATATAANVTYDDPALMILDNPTTYTGTISGLSVGDQLQLDGLNVASAGISGGVLTVNLQGGGSLTYNADPALNGTKFSVSQGSDGNYQDLLTVLCFLPGTLIATPHGETPVERLVVGDMVRTASGAERPIAWIGKGRVLATRGRRNAATPVVVCKGALGPNVPHRDLRVTKGHSFHIDGVLIPVEFLVNHRSIYWDDRAQEVELYHVELETHDVLLANGAPAESYRDDGNRWLFQNANSGWDQPPKAPCAPVLTGGPVVDAAWRRLSDRAGPRPRLPTTHDPDLHLLVDGRRVDAAWADGTSHVFRLPARPGSVRIVSRDAVPQELDTARDSRALGVALRQIMVMQGRRIRAMEAEDALLADGFHGFEPDDGIRWTNGDAAVPASLFDGFAGPHELVLRLGGTTSYMAEGELLQAA